METNCVYYRNQWQSDLICSWLFSSHGVWGRGGGGGCLAVGFFGRGHLPLLSGQRVQDTTASLCPNSRVAFPCLQPALNLALGGLGAWCRHSSSATILLLAQGRSAWEGWQPDVAARAIPAAFPWPLSFTGLPQAKCRPGCVLGCPRCYFFLGVGGHLSLRSDAPSSSAKGGPASKGSGRWSAASIVTAIDF